MEGATARLDLLSSHNSYHTLTSQLGGSSDDSNGAGGGPRRLSLAVVRARAARRTEFAEQVLAASKAAVEATDALLAASDALLAAPDLRISTDTNSTGAAGSRAGNNRSASHEYGAAVAATPDACEASDDSETDYTHSSLDIYALISQKPPQLEQSKEKQQPNHKQVLQQALEPPPPLPPLTNSSDPPIASAAEKSNYKQDEEDSGSSSGSESSSSSEEEEDPSTSSHVESTCAGRSSGRAASVEFLLKGRESPGGLAELPISASLLAGSFEPKVPIPEFITSLANPGDEQSTTIVSPALQVADTGEDQEDSSSDNSEESSSTSASPSSSEDDESSKEGQDPQLGQLKQSQQPIASIPNNATLQMQKTLQPTGLSVAAEAPKVSQTPVQVQNPAIAATLAKMPMSQQPTASIPNNNVYLQMQKSIQPTGLPIAAETPKVSQEPRQVQNPAIAAMLAKIPMHVPIAAPVAPSATSTVKIPPNLMAPHVQDNASSSDSSDSDDDSDSDEMESVSGRPSIGDAPSENPSDTTGRSGSSDIENDDYVQELLSELKETKDGPAAIPAPRVPVAAGHSGNVTMASQITAGPPKPGKNAASSLASLLPAQDEDSDEDSDGDDTEEDSDDSSEEASSQVSSSDDEITGSQGEEDDEYVDELLKELHATKPSSLIPEQKINVPIPAKPVVKASKMVNGLPTTTVMTDSSVSDDDISDMESSSSSDWDSSDSELFSADEVDSDGDVEETSRDAGDGHTSSNDGTSEGGEDDNYVDDLLNELQAPRAAPLQKPAPQKPAPTPAMPPALPAGLPVMPQGLAALASPLPGEGINLANIRAELEKVGRAVMTQKSGEAFVARAQILASINQLSSHVPNCVLDFLGKEVKANIARKKAKKDKPEKLPKKGMVDMVSEDDAMSEVSALSEIDISEKDAGSDGKFLIDTSAMNLGDEGNTEVSSKMEKALPRDLMRQNSSEALDKMFQQDCSNANMSANLVIDDDIEHIFNATNEYGLTTSRASRSMISVSSSDTSNSGNRKHKSRSRATSVATMSWGSNLEGRLPSVSKFECSLLFIDISGFTKLSTLLDPETLSKVINSYFQLIVSKVYEFNGDIQKFAGDAIFAEWRCTEKESMAFCVAAATACASQIVDECSDFPVMAGGVESSSGPAISSLNVHCALGSGQMIGIHVGDHTRRREYLFLGEPIDQLTWGADLAKHGEFVVSPEAFRSLSLAGVLDFKIRPSENEPAIIAKRGVTMFKSEKLKDYRISRIESAKSRGVTGHVEGLEVEDLKVYQKLMALYVHPVVAAIHMDQTSKMKAKSSAQERHREEAELRRVYIMFIHPLIEISEDNGYAVDQLNEIMNLTSTQLERYCGHLRQMIVDDKGLVLIGTFGLRGSTFPNMVAERALPATIALHNALQSQLGVDNRIGATFGEVYCGAVGGVKRHEYAVLGPSANLAARLMGSKDNPGILVECNIRRMASRKYAFNALPPVKAKGYSEPVPIFEPLSPLERSWGRIQPNFVGREPEIKALMGMARAIVSSDEPHSRLVFVASQSGMGKSTMIAHAIEHIRNLIGDDARRLVITKHVGKESSSLLPFGMFRSILLNVLANFAGSSDDKSLASGVSGFTSQSLSLHSLSCKSQNSSIALSLAKSEELLKVLCRELNTPSGFVDHLMHNLSGKSGGNPVAAGKAPSMKAMVSFMSRAFRRCTQETKLVVVALDDVQYVDEMTWKVLRQVFESCENVLLICAFDLSRSRDLKVEPEFWRILKTKYRPAGHFVPMELAGLGKEEITVMTMKTLGLQREDISEDLLDEVHIQSGGMPHFANEFLELVKRRQFSEMMNARMDGRISTTVGEKALVPNAMASVPEIILHRIDSFDVAVRNILNIAAVLGKSFSLKEVIAVLKENHDMREDVLQTEAVAALEMAVNEGILREDIIEENEDSYHDASTRSGKEAKEKSDQTTYAFYHSIWRSTILSLMLDARKKDVHKKIALSMEKEMKKDGTDFEFQMKLLGHWKSSGNTGKLTELALDVGKHFEQNLGLPSQSIRVYEEALEAWKDDKPSDYFGGISPEILNIAEPSDLINISSLHIALGRAFNGASRNAESALSFHDALRILRVPKNAEKVTDRAVGFPAYLGLYECLKVKAIISENNSKRYEQLLIKRFLEDTKNRTDKYHHVQAIVCQMDHFQRSGSMKEAATIQNLLYKFYDHATHTKKLRATYGSDEAATSFSNSAIWHWKLGDKEAALDACRFVIGKLMPKTDHSDVHQSFVIMYPVVLVMMSYDVAVQARKHFDRLVVKPFNAFFGEGKSSFFLPVYEPIMMLLHLIGSPELDEDILEEYTEWALDRDRLSFGTLANRRLGGLGRCADSLSAEICFLLAEHVEDEGTRDVLIEHGKEIAQEALMFNKEQGLRLAQQQVETLLSKYKPLMEEVDRVE